MADNTAAAAQAAQTTTRSYCAPAIGTYWPGEGGIYVGVGRAREGIPEHHLILPTAPEAIFKGRALGTYGVDVEGAGSDHNGMANTIALAAAGSDLCKEIRSLVIEGHDDFYLMSRTDARLCMANVPEMFEKEWYLLSTQYSSDSAWFQLFYDGYQGVSTKKFEARARAVRRLVLQSFNPCIEAPKDPVAALLGDILKELKGAREDATRRVRAVAEIS